MPPFSDDTSYFETQKDARHWAGFCQIYQTKSGFCLNFSRVPMYIEFPILHKPTTYPSLETALDAAILKVANLKNHPQLQPSHITLFKEDI